MTEIGWVIEHGASEVSRPSYWAGNAGWSYAHSAAVRFSRKSDAENVNDFLVREGYPTAVGMPSRICEHAWDDAPSGAEEYADGRDFTAPYEP